MGRPSKFTEETRTKILTALRGGNYRNVAAEYAGISYATLRNWLLLAADPHSPPEYVQFLADVEKAEADAEVADLALIRRAAQDGNWSAAAWVRERKNPERWGKKDRTQVEVSGPDGSPLSVQVQVGADPAAVASLAAVLASRWEERQDPLAQAEVIDAGGSEVPSLSSGDASFEAFRIKPGDLTETMPTLPEGSKRLQKAHQDRLEAAESVPEAPEAPEGPQIPQNGTQGVYEPPELTEFRERRDEQETFEEIVETGEWDWESQLDDFGDWD